MQVLLLHDVRKLGYVGDVVNVRPGYARNYLVPEGLATEPTGENIQAIQTRKEQAAMERAQRLKQFRELADRMVDVSVTIEANANPDGGLYGSVGPREIAAALEAEGYPVRADQVMLSEPIRTLDNRSVKLEFADEVAVDVKVWVVRAGEAHLLEDEQDGAAAGPEAQDEDGESTRFEAEPVDDQQ